MEWLGSPATRTLASVATWRAGRAARYFAATADPAWHLRAANKLAPYPRSGLVSLFKAFNVDSRPELLARADDIPGAALL
jgi:hypothetical protein